MGSSPSTHYSARHSVAGASLGVLLAAFFLSTSTLYGREEFPFGKQRLSVARHAEAESLLQAVLRPPRSFRERRETLIRLLQQESSPDITREAIPHSAQENLWVRVSGTDPRRGTILVGAHTDCDAESEGAIDNWSGCIMLAALHASFQRVPPRHDFLFAAFGAEETGQEGSRHFLRRMDPRERGRIVAMVNLECLGVDDLRIWLNQAADSLEEMLLDAAHRGGEIVYREPLYGLSADSFPFDTAGIASLTVHSLAPEHIRWINGPSDTAAHISLPRYRKQRLLLLRFLRQVDACEARPSPDDAERGWRQK